MVSKIQSIYIYHYIRSLIQFMPYGWLFIFYYSLSVLFRPSFVFSISPCFSHSLSLSLRVCFFIVDHDVTNPLAEIHSRDINLYPALKRLTLRNYVRRIKYTWHSLPNPPFPACRLRFYRVTPFLFLSFIN